MIKNQYFSRILAIILILVVGLVFAVPVPANASNQSDLQYIEPKLPEIDSIVKESYSKQQRAQTIMRKVKFVINKYKDTLSAADLNTLESRLKDMEGNIKFLNEAHNQILIRDAWIKEMVTELRADETGISNCSGNTNCWKDFEEYKAYMWKELNHAGGVMGYFAPAEEELKQILAREEYNGEMEITATEEAQIQDEANAAVPDGPVEVCFSVTGGLNIGICLRWGIGYLAYLIMLILSGLLKLGGMVLDESIKYTIVNLKTNLNNLNAVGSVWATIRDLANMSFIFVLMYIAIATILQVGTVNAMRTLRQLIIAAILVNFSLFITKLLIDASNIVTIAFYNNMVGTDGTVSGKVMDALGLPSLFAPKEGMITRWAQNWSSLIGATVGGILVLFVTTFNFFAAAWLFIFRYGVLIILLIISPIPFVGVILPQTQSTVRRWWDALWGQLLFPPIYMLFMWIAFKIASSGLARGGGLLNAFQTGALENPSGNAVGIIIRFFIMIFLIYTALVMAKSQASKVGGKAAEVMNKGLKVVDNMRDRTKAAGREALGYAGRGAVRASGLNKLDDKIKKSAFAHTRFGSWVQKNTTGAVVDSKFGSSNSVSTVEKEKKKLNDAYAKEIDKQVDKEVDKRADDKEGLRQMRLDKHDKALAKQQASIDARKRMIAEQEAILRDPTKNEADYEAASKMRKQHADELARLEADRRRRVAARADLAAMRAEDIEEANKEERNIILRQVRKEKAQELEDQVVKPATTRTGRVLRALTKPLRPTLWKNTEDEPRKAAAKKLRDKLKNKGSKSDDLLKQLAEMAKEDSGGGGGDKKDNKEES